MKKFCQTASAAILVALPSLAHAADGWNGFYAGGQVASQTTKLSFSGQSVDEDSTAFGLHLGYNYGLGDNFVLGGELTWDKLEYSDLPFDSDLTTQRVKIRAGYDLGVMMVYGAFGYANIGDGTDDEEGISYGIGFDYKVSEAIVLGAELLRDAYSVDGDDLDVTSLSFRISYQF